MVRTWFYASSSSTSPSFASNFVYKVNNIFQNELKVKECELEELGALN